MENVKCISTLDGNLQYYDITHGKTYKCIFEYDEHITIINDGKYSRVYNKSMFIDVTRELKIKKILNEIR